MVKSSGKRWSARELDFLKGFIGKKGLNFWEVSARISELGSYRTYDATRKKFLEICHSGHSIKDQGCGQITLPLNKPLVLDRLKHDSQDQLVKGVWAIHDLLKGYLISQIKVFEKQHKVGE